LIRARENRKILRRRGTPLLALEREMRTPHTAWRLEATSPAHGHPALHFTGYRDRGPHQIACWHRDVTRAMPFPSLDEARIEALLLASSSGKRAIFFIPTPALVEG
jgi:hypothetical protein